jgi:peroxiredoxin/TolA-binding protein
MPGGIVISAWIVVSLLGTAPAQSSAAPATRPAEAAPSFESYQQLRQHFSERKRSLTGQLLRDRLAALEAFFAKGKGEELENAYRDFVSAATEAGQFARAVEIAERYAKEFGSSSFAANVASLRVTALAEQGKMEAAATEWARLVDNAQPDDWGPACDAGIRLGDMMALAGRATEARKQYDEVNRRMSRYPNVGMFLSRRTHALDWIGKAPPALEGNDVAGRPARLEEHRGRVLLLDFWSTSCVPCLREMPGVIKVYEDRHAEGFDVIGICLDPDVSTLKTFLSRNRMPWRQLCDGQSWRGPNATNYSVRAVPTMYLIGRDGKIAFMPLSAEDLDYALTRLLKKPPGASASVGR